MSQCKSHKELLSFLLHTLSEQLGAKEKAGWWTVRKQLSSMVSLRPWTFLFWWPASPVCPPSCGPYYQRTGLEQKNWLIRMKWGWLFLEWRKGYINPTIYSILFLTNTKDLRTMINEQQSWSQFKPGSLTKICGSIEHPQNNLRVNWTLDVFFSRALHYYTSWY